MAVLEHRLVHLDLKGAPPTIQYLQELLPLLKSCGCTGLLIEYEDTFPFGEDLSLLVNKSAYYRESDIRSLLQLCSELDFAVVPLVQCFGHLEYALKHEKYFHLRECAQYPNNICPILQEAVDLVLSMIDEVVALHQACLGSKSHLLRHFHIGADEVYFLRRCPNCRASGQTEHQLFLSHVTRVANHIVTKHSLQPILWDDMLRQVDPELIRASKLSSLAQPMVWHYASQFQLKSEYFNKLASVFPPDQVWFAGSFRGSVAANCQITPLYHHSENTQAWLGVMRDYQQASANCKQLAGFVLTGWQRYDHMACLCELLPVSVPVLLTCLVTVREFGFTVDIHTKLSRQMGFPDLLPWNPFVQNLPPTNELSFPGWRVYVCVYKFQALRNEFFTFLNSDWVQGWMSARHTSRLLSSPAVVEKISSQVDRYRHELSAGEAAFKAACDSVLLPAGSEEWLDQQIRPLRRKCEKMIANANQIVSLHACVS